MSLPQAWARRFSRQGLPLIVALASVTSLLGCNDDDDGPRGGCRFDPASCSGGPGAFCRSNADCDGVCCTEQANCGGGMCTYSCQSSNDCPFDMRCQHNMCFFACSSDADCAPGQSCEHGNTVCEWP